MLFLGFWQLDRHAWKQELLISLTKAQSEPPHSLESFLSQAPSLHKHPFTRVHFTGKWDKESVIWIGPRTYKSQNGFHLFMLCSLSSQEAVWVNRGWVPSQERTFIPQGDHADVIGTLRWPSSPGVFTPRNIPEKRQWYWPDLALMGKSTHPFYVDIIPGAKELSPPFGEALVISLPHRHLEYALTWFSLALALLIVYGVYTRNLRLKHKG